MIKKFFNTKFLLFLVLALTAGLLVGLKLLQKPQPAPPPPSPLPSPSATPAFSTPPGFGDPTYFQEMEEKNENFYPLLKHLPYETPDFKIRYSDPLMLEIILKGLDPEKSKEKVLEWLPSIGADLEKHKLNFITP